MKKILSGIITVLVVLSMSCKTAEVVPEVVKEDDLMPAPDKLCALTFDDGPDSTKTPRVLDKLAAHGVVATFFVVGQNMNESTKPVMERMVAAGHEFGNHSWSYSGMEKMTAEEVAASIAKTKDQIVKYTGKEPAFFRPPNLATSDVMFATIGLPFASGVLGFDWSGTGTTVQKLVDNVKSGMKDGAIILLHDVQPDPHPTPDALDILIPALKKQGYEFVTLSELFARKNVTPDPYAKRMWTYVE